MFKPYLKYVFSMVEHVKRTCSTYVLGMLKPRVTKRNSYTMKFMKNAAFEYGQMNFFVQVGSKKALALVQSFEQIGSICYQHTELHIKKVHHIDHLIAVYLDHIIAKCVYMVTGNEL
jgi:hypothetical protein